MVHGLGEIIGAMTQVKRLFIREGPWREPLYRAPFVYYGVAAGAEGERGRASSGASRQGSRERDPREPPSPWSADVLTALS